MRKSEVDILYNIEKVGQNSSLLGQLPKNPQQRFMMTYAAIYLINKGSVLPLVDKLLLQRTGSASELLLKLKYMKQCMENRVNLDNKDFHVLNTLVLWVQELKKAQKNPSVKLVDSILLPHVHQMAFEYYEQFIVYLNYLAGDIQNLFKAKSIKWQPDDLILFLQIALPRIHYNIVLPADLLGSSKKEESRDQLFCNLSLEYFTKSRINYRGLCKLILTSLINLQLKATQMRSLIDIACRYYLLFWADSRQEPIQLFVAAFNKATEPVRYSLTDELLLFFKMSQKLGATGLQEQLRRNCSWIDSLLLRYKQVVIGHPKEDVSPFNPLSIREKFSVEAGKSVERVIEIYQDETLFYFMIQVGENDINLKLFYLGDFESKTEVKKLLHIDEKKSGENRFAYMASKRGLYMIQFDNTYSWINSKAISFQQVTLIKANNTQYSPWVAHMYQLNAARIDREPKQIKVTVIEGADKRVQGTIKTYNLQEIYSSDHYNQELTQEESLQIEKNVVTGNKELLSSQEKLPVFQEDATDPQPELSKLPEHDEKSKPIHVIQQSTYSQGDPVASHQQQIKKHVSEQELQIQKQRAGLRKDDQLEGEKKEQPIKIEPKKEESLQEHKVQNYIQAQGNINQFLGQANLSLIDSIFSLLISTQGHTYQFETNLQDRIVKRLKSYCQSPEHYQWIVNGQARDWLKRRGFGLTQKAGAYTLFLSSITNSFIKRQSSQKE